MGITAYEGLKRAQVKAGQKVLVHGGSGGVGHVALQLANYFGAEVYSTGGGAKQLALIEELGATAINYKSESVADYTSTHTNGKGFDVVFDSVGGMNMLNSFEAATINGHVASTVAMVDIDLSLAHFKGLSLHVVFMLIPMLNNVKREEHGKILTELANIVDNNQLRTILDDSQYSLQDISKAHARLASGKAMGKVVVTN